jgi:hypothetical protein
MPTKPLESLLYRELSIVAGKEEIDIASPLLMEVINFSTHVYQRCVDSSKADENVDLSILMLYLHLIEMADGIDILIQASCPAPAQVMLRSMFEALLSMEYILERDYVQRSLSWLAFYARYQLRISEELDVSTQVGQEFKRALNDDRVTNLNFTELEEMAQKKSQNLKKLLSRDQFIPIVEEIKRSKKYVRTWYGLFDGPRNLRQLARHLNREAQYIILYRGWSQITHAQDVSRYMQRMLSSDPAENVLRNPKDVKSVASFAVSFLLNGTRLILDKFRPGEDISNWYLSDVQEKFHLLWSSG